MYIIRMNTSDSALRVFHPIEEDYNKKIKEAMKNENQNDLINLMFELKVLRSSVLKQGKKKTK